MTDLVTHLEALEAGLLALADHLRSGGKEAVEQAIKQVKSPKQRTIQPIDSEVDVYLYVNGNTRLVSYGPRCYTVLSPRPRDLDLVPCHERNAEVYVVYEYGLAGDARSLVSEVPTKVAARYLAESHFRMLMRERSLKEEIDRLRHLETYRKQVREAVTGETGGSATDEQVLEKIRLLTTQPVYAEEQRIGDRRTRKEIPAHWQVKSPHRRSIQPVDASDTPTRSDCEVCRDCSGQGSFRYESDDGPVTELCTSCTGTGIASGPEKMAAQALRNELCRQLKLVTKVPNEIILARMNAAFWQARAFREAICRAVGVSSESADDPIIKLVGEMAGIVRAIK